VKASEEPEAVEGVAEASDALEADTAVGSVVVVAGEHGAVVVVVVVPAAPDVVVVLAGTDVVVGTDVVGSVVAATEFARMVSVGAVVEVEVDVLVLVDVLVDVLVEVLVVVGVPAVVDVLVDDGVVVVLAGQALVVVEAESIEVVVVVEEVEVDVESAATGAAPATPMHGRVTTAHRPTATATSRYPVRRIRSSSVHPLEQGCRAS
jgi:hypothetical protein